MSKDAEPTIAFLGLGNMGGPMSARLVSSGYNVRGFDPATVASACAAKRGVLISDAARAAVEHSDVVITMLPNGEAVKRCYRDILPVASPETLFIDSSTISVDDAIFVHEVANKHGFDHLDAPVSGGVAGAVAGTLTFMVGGSASVLAGALPMLECMAGKVIHCGASGCGQAAKICNNMVLAVQQIAVAEAFLLAERLGLSAQTFFDVITRSTGNCWAANTNCPVPGPVPESPSNHDFAPGFSTVLMNKDLGLALEAISATGSPAPIGTQAATIFGKMAHTHGDKDFSAVIELLGTAPYV
ncbi:3-hydroxyisobutyrate dehydrogenase [Nocardia sp. NPDC051911]|uniref:3-hydroxyisobutyrate dehydrogenase n=1 Tax=Nocardia sp. NPDC051911 TaxID=3154648 RepID=UPI00344A3F96